MPGPIVSALIAHFDGSFEGPNGDYVPEQRRTLLELILSSGSAHEAHHGGQLSYLRGLQGI